MSTPKKKPAKPAKSKARKGKAAGSGRIGRPPGTTSPRFSEAQVAAALKATGGIFAHAAAWLQRSFGKPCSRPAISNYVKSSKRLQGLIEQINEVHLDDGEARLKSFIENGSERSLHFFLATKGKHRGYTRRVEATGKDGAPLAPPPDLKNIPTDKLRALESLLADIDASSRPEA